MPTFFARNVLALALSALAINTSFATTESKDDNAEIPAVPAAKWQFQIAPYVWAIGMNGTTQIGTRRVHIDASISDILSHLDYAGMLWLEANKENLGLFLNIVFATLSDDATDGPLTMSARTHYSLYTAGLSYTVYHANGWNISPYTGLRYTHNKVSLNAATPTVNFYLSDNQRWIDPILGARFIYQFNQAWSLTAAGDVGGTNTSGHYSYNILGLLGYVPQSLSTHPTIYLGYRMLSQTYLTGHDSGTYLWDMKLSGPMLGIAFNF